MSKLQPDHHDLDLTLKLYELRRETTTRASRDALNFTFWPRSYADIKEVSSNPKNPLNAAWRQMSSYWEMVYGFARHGLCNADFLIENNAEGLFLFAKIQPFLKELRADSSPTAFQSCEWITENCEIGKTRFAMIMGRVKHFAEIMAKQ
jgi:hypothetical protein